MHSFDPLTIPLTGQQLVEASAGTGKTFSIAQLYLRFILEGGLDVDNILVVTFTISATDELRQRIRLRLREALDSLLSAGTGNIEMKDEVLKALLDSIQDRQQAIQRLTDAISRMDESSVFTIHSFCKRMLQEHSFESGSPFDAEFIESESLLRIEIIQDFWRQRFYSAASAETEWAAVTFQEPQGLLMTLSPLLAHIEVSCIPEVNDDAMKVLQAECEKHFLAAMEKWREQSEEILEILKHDSALTRNEKSYRLDRVEIMMAGMERLSSMKNAPWLLPKRTELLAASVMAGHLKKNKTAPEHSFFTLFDAFVQNNQQLTRLARIHVITSALQYLKAELQKRKNERAQMYFNDLLVRMDGTISGQDGRDLVRRIRQRYKVALVDEFQDTDPLQYRIFHNLFGKEPSPGLYMIGDPKQSIYSFRGADVFAYIKAKRDTLLQSAAFTMDTNYRSTSAMVDAVNTLFDKENSFVFGDDIGFTPVQSGSKADEEPFIVQGTTPDPLQAMILPVDRVASPGKHTIAKGRAENAAARWTAMEIARLLDLGRREEAQIGQQNLTGRDLAVLVRTHREAEMIQQELARLRISSVYYSQDSVLVTNEARDLHLVLTALLDLSDTARVNTALTTPLFGLDAHQLEQLLIDAARWDAQVAKLEEYNLIWRSQGVAAMLQKLLGDQLVVQRLIKYAGGERKLTNYLHLTELLQEASATELGMDGLVRWFGMQRNNPGETGSNQQLRLESDENLVRIVTVHKAKGLEYPVVFLPFIWNCRPVKSDDMLSFHLPEGMQHVVDLGSGNSEYFQLAEQERLAEDMRLLYVAVTRARYCCYFCWGKMSGMEQSAMAWLLHRGSKGSVPVLSVPDEERIIQDVEALNAEKNVLEFPAYKDETRETYPAVKEIDLELVPKVFQGQIDTGWIISSYSRMARAAVHLNRAEEVEYQQPVTFQEITGQNVFTFPRGAEAGTCLHNILEVLDFEAPLDEDFSLLVKDHLQLNGLDVKWSPVVCRWVEDIIKTPLEKDSGLRLKGIQQDNRLAELGFYFTMESLKPDQLNSVLRDFGYRPIEMMEQELNGLMRGYIDLVFCCQDKYFLADYKSNHLGFSAADYTHSRMKEAMEEHRYDLQYLIYVVAMHRYLESRIKNYDYDKHFGGVYYLFLRGMREDYPDGNGIYYILPERELIERLDKCFGRPGK